MSANARQVAFRALAALAAGRTARLEAALDRRGLAARDRDLALELARGVERWRIWLDCVLQTLMPRGLPRDPLVGTALRLGAYQILRLTRIPPHAAVNETVGLVSRNRPLVNAVLRRLAGLVQTGTAEAGDPRATIGLPGMRVLRLPRPALPDAQKDRAGWLALSHALPRFLLRRWLETFGEATATALAAAANRTPGITLRANGLRGTLGALRSALAEQGVRTEASEHPRCLRWVGGELPFDAPAFAEGLFLVQDPTALRAAEAMGAQPGEVLLDLCAAPGGKAVALAEAVAPAGRVHAHDVAAERRQLLAENTRRLGLEDLISVHDDLADLPRATGILVDAPCSNTGVLARRVEVRHRLRESDLGRLAETQRALLADALQRVQAGGRVVYSTCSIEAEENHEVVASLLRPGWALVAEELTLPDPPRHDGGYHAVLRRDSP